MQAPHPEQILELMAQRIEEVGLHRGTGPHHDRGVAVPPTVIGAWDWARSKTRPDWRTRENRALWDDFHAACFEALHRLAVHCARGELVAPAWWQAGQKAWESHVVAVWGEFQNAENAVATIRVTALDMRLSS